MSRPTDMTLRRAVQYLESIGLAVYGPCMDLGTGYRTGSNMDFNVDMVVKYRALKEKQPAIPFMQEEEYI